MTSSHRATGIKELAYQLAKEFGWDFTYDGGMELEGEFIDDAELTRTIGATETVVSLCFDETSRYSLCIERGAKTASAFAVASPATVEFERYGLSLAELDALARQQLEALSRKG